MKIKSLILVLGIASIAFTSCSNSSQEPAAEASKYSYESVENDPFGLQTIVKKEDSVYILIVQKRHC